MIHFTRVRRYFRACCFLIICSSASSAFARDPALDISVDRRVELMCIVFRLAGAPEYNMGVLEPYNRDVEEHFGSFRAHPVVELARELRASRGVSFDAPMTLAVLLPKSADLPVALPLDSRPPTLDGRWVAQEAREFLARLEEFKRETRFDEFFDSHRTQYDRWVQILESRLAGEIQTAWYHDFFGERRPVVFRLFLSPLSRNNYGPRAQTPEGIDEFYAILGIWQTRQGEPVFDQAASIVIHEFAHSFVNPPANANASKLRRGGENLFAYIKEDMKPLGYSTWDQMVNEALVRTTVARYRHRFQGERSLEEELRAQERYGFFMIRDLSDLFAEYEVSRDEYPTFEALMPRIVQFFDTYEQSMGLWQRVGLKFHPLLRSLLIGLCSGVVLGGLAIYFFKRRRGDYRRPRSSR